MLLRKNIKNLWRIFIVLIVVHSESAYPLNMEENATLDLFFRTLLKDSEAGFVFYGQKPLCIRGFFIDGSIRVDPDSVALKEGADVWKKISHNPQEIIIHIYDQTDSLVSNCRHILVINRKLFLDAVKADLPLFQYILGPAATPESLLELLLADGSTFHSVLKEDKVLIGILLGYGAQNALYVSRIEDIEEELFSSDVPPFQSHASQLPKPLQCHKNRFLNSQQGHKRMVHSSLSPSFGYTSLDDEMEHLCHEITLPPKDLTSNKPTFLFGLRKDDPANHQRIEQLKDTQKKIQRLLKAPNFLDELFEFIPNARQPPASLDSFRLSLGETTSTQLSSIIAKYILRSLERYDENFITAFIDSFGSPTQAASSLPAPTTNNPEYIRNMAEAKQHLQEAEEFFHQLSENADMHCLVAKKLYYKVIRRGNGKKLLEEPTALIRYQISDPNGTVLASSLHAKTMIALNETIPGFAHGIKGMHEGETREIYIHPSLGYGIYTFLEKGIYLKALVTLEELPSPQHDVGIQPIEELELACIVDEAQAPLCAEENQQAARFLGAKTKAFYLKSLDVNTLQIYNYLQQLQDSKKPAVKLSKIENDLVNKIHWNLLFSKSSPPKAR